MSLELGTPWSTGLSGGGNDAGQKVAGGTVNNEETVSTLQELVILAYVILVSSLKGIFFCLFWSSGVYA